jgi:1,4-alpha-glucan branching enzyme
MLIFVAALNQFYKANPSLWQQDFSYEGFQWLDLEDRQNSIISYVRYGKDRADHLVCLFNYTPQTHYDYKLGLPTGSRYEQVFCSDDTQYGGSNACGDPVIYQPVAEPFAQAPFHTTVTVPPLAGLILRPVS